MSEENQSPEAQPQPAKSAGRPRKVTKVTNATRGPHVVGVQVAQPGETVELTKADQENERTMKKVKHAIKNGYLTEA